MPAIDDFDEWYRAVRPDLVRTLVVGRGHDVDVAAEATDEAMVRALEDWSRVATMASPEGWVYTVAVNLIRRRFRRRAMERDRSERLVEATTGLDPAEAITLWAAVADLDPTAREALALRYVAGLSEREVAAAMEVPVGTASALLTRARRRLHHQLSTTEGASHEI